MATQKKQNKYRLKDATDSYLGSGKTRAMHEGALMSAWRKQHLMWQPAKDCLSHARPLVNGKPMRGVYECTLCKTRFGKKIDKVRKSGKNKGKTYKVDSLVVDHIEPVVDPATGDRMPDGGINWTLREKRMFIAEEGYQAICHECHKEKSDGEKKVAAARRRKEKRKQQGKGGKA